jgi:hypothetical protein
MRFAISHEPQLFFIISQNKVYRNVFYNLSFLLSVKIRLKIKLLAWRDSFRLPASGGNL